MSNARTFLEPYLRQWCPHMLGHCLLCRTEKAYVFAYAFQGVCQASDFWSHVGVPFCPRIFWDCSCLVLLGFLMTSWLRSLRGTVSSEWLHGVCVDDAWLVLKLLESYSPEAFLPRTSNVVPLWL